MEDLSNSQNIESTNNDIENNKKGTKRGRVFIRNLPFTANEQSLTELFSQVGPVSDVRIPVNEETKKLKGFAFLQYSTKAEALVAIKKFNGKKMQGRQLNVSLAFNKEEYAIVKERDDKEKDEGEKFKKTEYTKKVYEKNNQKFDSTKTLFVNNLSFSTDESSLREFFETYGEVIYVKIVKNKDTQTSKGSGFVMMKNAKDAENVVKIYNRNKENANSSLMDNSINLSEFELDGRNINVMSAVSKEDAVKIKETEALSQNIDKSRNNHLLYYGIGNNSLLKLDNKEISEEDKLKREALIKQKKTNFQKNPNLHVSNTRISLRNLTKQFEESDIKDIINPFVEKFVESITDKEKKKFYEKNKKIKQIKILRSKTEVNADNKARSKCSAYVQVIDENLGRFLIDRLNNYKVGPKKGLIVDFSLDDIRKSNKREKKMVEIKQKRKEDNKEDYKIRRKNIKEKLIKQKTVAKGASIDDITDINTLIKLYSTCISRGKKQRIKKKLVKLGYNPQYLPSKLNEKIAKVEDKKSNYVATKLEIGNQNLNKSNRDKKDLKKFRNKNKSKNKYKDNKQDEDDFDETNPLFHELERKLKNSLVK